MPPNEKPAGPGRSTGLDDAPATSNPTPTPRGVQPSAGAIGMAFYAKLIGAPVRFEVVCRKTSGAIVPWNRYDTHEEARAIVERLAELGASAFVREVQP